MRSRSLFALAGVLLFSAAAQAAFAERPLTIIVPASADTTARMLAREFGAVFKQPITIVEQGRGCSVVDGAASAPLIGASAPCSGWTRAS